MSNVEIKKVATKKELKAFIDFHYDLYKGNKYDTPTLFLDDWNTFSKDKNAAFEFCDAEFFLAYKEGKIVGRVVAIINKRANEKWGNKSVRFGWIDFIDDIEVSGALLKAVEDYGREHGMKQVVGPLGFTDMDPEGMLTWGFDQLGTMATIYNYPYYPEHMERLGGWEKDNDYVEFKLIVPDTVPEKYSKIAQMVEKRYNLHVKKFTKKEVYKGGYGLKMFHLINDTFKDLYGYSEMSDRQIKQYLDMWMPLVDFNLVTGIEDWNTPDHELIGIGITIPSLARALQKCRRGRLMPFGWWHVLMALKFGKTKIVDLLLIGVKPEYRSKGANALMFADLIPWYQKYGYEWGESQVEMETNENVQAQWQALNPIHHKSRRCFKKIL
ncbi:MAG: N-acetyltransferase [Prevotella sp.]|nr:N-acetyltransferase [Prevotella sp.]MBR4924801.1 N-acetyltransferase [Prevotella sp.]